MAIKEIKEEEDFYYNEQGYKVFTENFILKEDIVVKMVVSIVHMVMIKRQICSTK